MDPSKIVLFVLDEADIMIATQGHQDQTIRIHKWVGRALSRADLPSPPPPLPSPSPPLTSPSPPLPSPPSADWSPTGPSTPTARRLCSLPLMMKM